MVNGSRYIGSSDGIQMQQQALAQVAGASKQGVDEANAGVQQYLRGAVENSKAIVELTNAKAQIEATNASRPTALQQVVETGLKTYMGIRQQEKQEELKRAEEQQALLRNKLYNQANDEIETLIGNYEGSNWLGGEDLFKHDAIKRLAPYEPKSKEDIQAYNAILKKINDTVLERKRKVGARLDEEQDKLQISQANIEENKLRGRIQPLLKNISNQSLDAQAEPLFNQVVAQINEWRGTDNGIPEGKKSAIAATLLGELNASYGQKLDRWYQYSGKLQDLNAYVTQDSRDEALLAANQISLQERQRRKAELDSRYPGLSSYAVRLGDQEKLKLELLQTNEKLTELSSKASSAAVGQYAIDNESVKALAANLVFDPLMQSSLDLYPGLKDNPQYKNAVRLATLYKEYENDKAALAIQDAQAMQQAANLNLQNVSQIVQINKSLALKQQQGQELTPREAADKAVLELVRSINPAIGEQLDALSQKKTITQLDEQAIRAAIAPYNTAIESAKQALAQESQARAAAVTVKYQDLLNLGLLVPRDELFKRAQNARPLIENLNKNLDQLRLQTAEQSQQLPYGVQPNFNPSSAFAPVTDDRGNLLLVPRQKAQTIRMSDGSQIVTPVAAGVRAPISQGGRFGDPREYRNGTHYGLDFALKKGDKAIALVSGTVVHAGKANNYGNLVDILGDNGVVYRYAHQSAVVKPGQRVYPGQLVSISDGSGVGHPHLHFEVRPNPQFTNGRYDINKNYGQSGAIDPLEHLRKLNAGDSSVVRPRGDTSAFRHYPTQKAPANSTLTSNGGAIYANTYQRVGSTPAATRQRFGAQRPMKTGATPAKVKVGAVSIDHGDDLGYAELRKDTGLMKAFHETAERLGIPTQWIVDIVRQETGGINPYKDHNGNHYGLFGFGRDSGLGAEVYAQLRAGKVDASGQLKLYEDYLRTNGWDKLVKQKQGNLTIADVWAFTRMGWNDRHKFWKTGDLSIQPSKSIKMTYGDELKLLGKWVGRKYDLSDRQSRNAPVSEQFHGSCSLCNQLQASLSDYVHHAHDIG